MKTSITDGQKKQYMCFVEDAAERALKKVALDKNGIQRLITKGDEFQTDIVTLIKKHSTSNQYANEEVNSDYAYPYDYQGPKPIKDQIKTIANIFELNPNEAFEYIKNLPELPDSAEGWFAIPLVSALAKKHFPGVTNPAEQYCRAVQLVHQKIAGSRKFYNYRKGKITTDRLRVHARTAHALDLITKAQPGDILIIAAQFGMRHRGRSTRRTREVFVVNEFGLGSLAVGSMLLTHPEREVQQRQLHINCAGDECVSNTGDRFDGVTAFGFDFGGVNFSTHFASGISKNYGAASGFIPLY